MNRRLLIAFLALAALSFGLVACGDDDDDGGTTEEASGPTGPLTSGGVGNVTRGASPDEVEEAFGEPDSEESVVGCELGGPDAPKVLTWTYDLGDGELIMNFDPGAGELVDYRSTSSSLETSLGDTVGDDFATVQENWGSDFKPFPLGQPTPQEGIWQVDEGTENNLLFDIQGGAVTGISGGFVQICE
jgi:hypothetical protein